MGDAGGVRRLIKPRLGDSVALTGDVSLPKGVMSPSAERRCVERSFGNRVQFLRGDLGNSGAGIEVKGDWMLMLLRLKGEVGKRWGIFMGVLQGDVVTFSCSSSEARPRFVLNLFAFCAESLLKGDVTRMSSRGGIAVTGFGVWGDS